MPNGTLAQIPTATQSPAQARHEACEFEPVVSR